jgi:hypothetical protein
MAEKNERCHGSKEDYTNGQAHQPHWWKMYTRWCDGKKAGS